MRHPNSRALAEYWETIRRGRIAPARTDVSPRDLSALLTNLFILQRVDDDHALFRLAGTGFCDLYRREFRDQNFLAMWSGADRLHMRSLLTGAAKNPSPAAARVEAETIDGLRLEAEILLAPLLSPSMHLDRFIGLFQPLAAVESLKGRPLVSQRVVAAYPPRVTPERRRVRASARITPEPAAAPHLRLVTDNKIV